MDALKQNDFAESTSLWHPLKSTTFRNLLVANVVSDIGAFMQTVGAAWLMISLNGGPMYVALIQTASALPFFVLALPAGAIGDIVDRRKIILLTQVWMVSLAVILAAITLLGAMSPIMLLVLTSALSAGDAFQTPAWRALLPELVEKDDLAAASSLNGIEFNFARAVGPALGGAVVALAGAGAAFSLNALSFAGVIIAVTRWHRVPIKRATPPESVGGATRAALRYIRYSPAVWRIFVRAGAAMFFASSLLALLPSVARGVNGSAASYGVLLGSFGCGAVLGAVLLQQARARWSAEVVVSASVVSLGLATIATALLHAMWALAAVIDLNTKDYGGFVERADKLLSDKLALPAGYSFKWSGEYEFELRAKERLKIILPAVFFVIFLLLYMVFHSVAEAIVLIFPTIYAMSGGLLLQWWLGYNFSVAVWVGYIALFGIAVETGVVMVVYLREALDHKLLAGSVTKADIHDAAIEGAVHRLRPKLMTVFAVLASLVPILWESGVGSDVMKPIAAPIVGGMITSTIHVLILVPVFFVLMKTRSLRHGTLRSSQEMNEEGMNE